ncbi:MAG TPA: hypothetical protein VF678_06825, partial [bacterium]
MQTNWLQRPRQWLRARVDRTFGRGKELLRYRWCQLTFPLPVTGAFAVFKLAARSRRPWPSYMAYGREVIGVPPAQLRQWYLDSWWGTQANAAVHNRLQFPEREAEVMRLVEPVDWAPLDAALARGRGVLVAVSHWGVPRVLSVLLAQRGITPQRVAYWTRYSPETTDFSHRGTPGGYTRAYLQGFQHLRNGGVVIISPDGPLFRESIEERFFNRPCQVSLAGAALARITGAVTFHQMAVWEGTRIRLQFDGPWLPEDGDANAVDRRWMRRYLDWLERMVCAHPRATRFDQLLPYVDLSLSAR